MEVGKVAISSHFVDNFVDKSAFFPGISLKCLWIMWITFFMGVEKRDLFFEYTQGG
jgi:hypothetical protein